MKQKQNDAKKSLTDCEPEGYTRQSKKGFTLIELLAVIVILAVIALIATPIIMNVINESKQGAAKDAMFGYVKAVELAATKTITATKDAPSGEYQIKDGNIYQGSTKILDVTFKGTQPANDYGKVILVSGNVTYAKLKFDGIEVEYDGNSVRTDNFLKSYAIGEVVYFDPTGAVTNCDASKIWTPSNTATTCYKWNVIKDNGSSIEMLLDHNTTSHIAWNSSGNNENGPLELYNQLKTDTNEWSKVETLTSSDNVTRKNSGGGTYTINYNGMKARLISGQEVATIGGDVNWKSSQYTGMVYSTQSWLYQNLTSSNTVSEPIGYWSDTAFSIQRLSDSAWGIYNNGKLNDGTIITNNILGIRPVVRVLKSNI